MEVTVLRREVHHHLLRRQVDLHLLRLHHQDHTQQVDHLHRLRPLLVHILREDHHHRDHTHQEDHHQQDAPLVEVVAEVAQVADEADNRI